MWFNPNFKTAGFFLSAGALFSASALSLSAFFYLVSG